MDNLLGNFHKVATCIFKAEQYSVRDNGSILKHPQLGKKARPTDNAWTFGKLNAKTGYLEIASVRVHSIVATAFHGVSPTSQHVIDHIDTNKQNNRPENLRWVTRLENILLNPITARRIALVCGSVEAFLSDPGKFRDQFPEPNLQWMCTVSKEDGQASLERMLEWSSSSRVPAGGSLGSWIFSRNLPDAPVEYKPEFIVITSLTPDAVQRNWKQPSEFPCCPMGICDKPLAKYAENLEAGLVFCRNDMYSSIVVKHALSDDGQHLYVVSKNENGIKGWALAEITFESDEFMHTSLGTFFTENGAEKYYTLAQGKEWLFGDTFDDNC